MLDPSATPQEGGNSNRSGRDPSRGSSSVYGRSSAVNDALALTRFAVRFGFLTEEDGRKAVEHWKTGEGNRSLGDILVEEGFLQEADLEMLSQVMATGSEPALPAVNGNVPHPTPGMRLGEFRIVKQLARGSMGVVYEAVQESLGRTVAIKVLPGELTRDERTIERFRREAGAAASLDHPGIVKVLSVGEEGGYHYYAMDLVRGRSLDAILETERLPFRRTAEILRDAAHALEAAHDSGVVHRDIKPGNLMINEQGKVLITDFGLARVETTGTLTRMDEVVGTPMYMSPEQARGERESMGPRTDIYSLGATLYEALTLSPPFRGSDLHHILSQVIGRDPASPRSMNALVPRDLETICLKAMEKEQDKRYASAQALADDLSRFLRGDPIHARPPSLVALIWRKARRNKPASFFLAAFLAVLLATCAFLLLRHVQSLEKRRASLETADVARREGEILHAGKMEALKGVLDIEGDIGEYLVSREKPDLLARVKELQAEEDLAWGKALPLFDEILRESPSNREANEGVAFIALCRAQTEFLQERRRWIPDFSRVKERMATVRRHDLERRFEDDVCEMEDYIDGFRGALEIETRPPGACAVLSRVLPQLEHRVGEGTELGRTPLSRTGIEPGSYLLTLTLAGRIPSSVPLFFSRARPRFRQHLVELPLEAEVPPNLRLVSGGEFLFGGRRDNAAPAQWKNLPPFFLGILEVTFEEYLEFLNQRANEVGALYPLEPFVPKEWGVRPEGGRKQLRSQFKYDWERNRFLPPSGWESSRRLPVMGIPLEGAMEYCKWRARRSLEEARAGGLTRYMVYRLPTEAEWEKGARGADGRLFPWGNRFDVGLCNNLKSYEKSGGKPEAVPGGRFPAGASPYGLLDMAGNVAEWTSSTDPTGREHIVKGGDFNSAWYELCSPERRLVSVYSRRAIGFRLAGDLEPVAGK